MLSLARGAEGVAQLLVLPLVLVLGLLLVAYQFGLVRDGVLRVFNIARELLRSLGDALDAVAATLRAAVVQLRRHVTDDERIPLPRLLVAVLALAPILFLLVIVEVRLWGAYFESLFPEQLDVPLIGQVPGGVLTAIVPVAAGFLLGWLFEAAFGTFPLPILSGLASRDAQARGRGLLVVGLCVLWLLLAATVYDAANEVYDGLGESTCALQSAPSAVSLSTEPALDPAAQATCVADWKANDRARSIRVILGELTLHLSVLIAWVVLGALGLGLLAGMATLALGSMFAAWLVRLLARLVAALASLGEALLGIVQAIGKGLVHVLRGLGLPLPALPTEPAAQDTLEVVLKTADRPTTTNGVHTTG